MVKLTTLMITILLLAPLLAFSQEADDDMVKEFEKFIKSKGGQGQLRVDSGYRDSVGRRKQQLVFINAAIEEQDKALTGSRDDLEKIITLYSSRAKSRGSAVDHYLYGRILGQTGELDEAYREFREALSLDKYLTWAWDGLGVYHSNKENWPEAIEKFKRVLQLWPGHVKATFGLAQCYFRLERYSEGVTRLQEILSRKEVRDNPQILRQTRLLIAEALRGQRKYADAIDVLSEVLKTDRNDVRVLAMRAWCFRRMEKLEEAARDYEAILVLKPKERRFYEQLADCQESAGRNHDAMRSLERLLDNAGGDLDASRTEHYQEVIEQLRAKPATEDPKKKLPKLDDYLNILDHSPHEKKREEAIIILSNAPPLRPGDPRTQDLYKAFLGALKDKDHVVRCVALEQLNSRFGHEGIMNLTKFYTRSKEEPHPCVRGMASYVLQDYPAKMVTATLIMAMKEETDLYAFRRIHESLNASTLAWIERVLPRDLEIEDMVRIRRKWLAWYKKHRDLYRKNEPKDFSLK